MNDEITVTEIEVETSLGMVVRFDENLDFTGVGYPAGWTNESMESDEFGEGESIDEEALIGRRAGSKSEARAILASELSTDNMEFDADDIEQMDLSDYTISFN